MGGGKVATNGTHFTSLLAAEHLVDAFPPLSNFRIKEVGQDGDKNALQHTIPFDQPASTDVGISKHQRMALLRLPSASLFTATELQGTT